MQIRRERVYFANADQAPHVPVMEIHARCVQLVSSKKDKFVLYEKTHGTTLSTSNVLYSAHGGPMSTCLCFGKLEFPKPKHSLLQHLIASVCNRHICTRVLRCQTHTAEMTCSGVY